LTMLSSRTLPSAAFNMAPLASTITSTPPTRIATGVPTSPWPRGVNG
jgi:hypothetical protein